MLDIAQSLLGGFSLRARILPKWLTKNYTAEPGEPNNISEWAGLGGANSRQRPAINGAIAPAGRGCYRDPALLIFMSTEVRGTEGVTIIPSRRSGGEGDGEFIW